MKKHFTLAPIFSDGMIFQANKPIRIFGKCKKGIDIRVSFLDQEVKIRTKSEEFFIELKSNKSVERGFSFTVSTKKQKETFYNCLIGDIYLFVGGINLDLSLKNSIHNEDLMNDKIRFFDMSSSDKADYIWKITGRQEFENISAMSYVYAKYMAQKISTPIGIICCSKCDATIFSLMTDNDVLSNPNLTAYINVKKENIDDLKISELFKNFIEKLCPMSLNSIVIYQGETDYKHAGLYASSMKRIMTSYRILFKDLKLPYIIVQLAGYNYTSSDALSIAHIRTSQSKLADESQNIYIASAIDVGDKDDLILKNKYLIAKRIANVVLEKVHKIGKNSISPVYYSHHKEGDKLVIHTKNNYLNLVSKSGMNLGFTGTKNGIDFIHVKNVHIMNNRIIINQLNGMKEIRYAYERFPFCDIYTTNDLPLLPFKVNLVE